MSYEVDFVNVSTVGLESSPVAEALAGLRANEGRYFKNNYDHSYTTVPAEEAQDVVDWVHRILEEERGIVIASKPLEVADVKVDGIKWPEVFYESGLAVDMLWTIAEGGKRAVGPSSPRAWRCPRSSRGSSSRGRSPSSRGRSGAPTSRSRGDY